MENAKRGLKILFTAELLMIAADVIGEFVPSLWWLLLTCLVIIIVAFFMNLNGLKSCAKDHPDYKKAYVWTIVGIVIDLATIVLSFVIKNEETLNIINKTDKNLSELIEFIVAYQVMKASRSIVSDEKLKGFISSTMTIYTIVYVISTLLGGVHTIISEATVTALVFVGIGLVAAVLAIIGEIKYLILLNKVSNSL